MEIRKPSDTELDEIMLLSPKAMLEGTMGQAESTVDKIKQLVEPLLNKGCYYLVATDKDALQGWILLGASKDPLSDIRIGFIYELYVREEHRGKGISKRLMTIAVNDLKAEGYPEVRLSVFAGNHAIRLYEKLGFSVRNVTLSLPL